MTAPTDAPALVLAERIADLRELLEAIWQGIDAGQGKGD